MAAGKHLFAARGDDRRAANSDLPKRMRGEHRGRSRRAKKSDLPERHGAGAIDGPPSPRLDRGDLGVALRREGSPGDFRRDGAAERGGEESRVVTASAVCSTLCPVGQIGRAHV